MRSRGLIRAGTAAGVLWALVVVWFPQRAGLPFIPAPVAVPGALVMPALVLMLMIGRVALRRSGEGNATAKGMAFTPGSRGWVDQRVLTDTVEQLALAVVTWPFVANSLGGGVVLALGFGFAAARVLFWIGCHAAPPLRALGFVATFFPTVLALVWSVVAWLA